MRKIVVWMSFGICSGGFTNLWAVFQQSRGTETWTLKDTVHYVLQQNPELKSMAENLKIALLEEPGLLANTDPFIFGSLQKSEDWSPTPVPAILGMRTIEERFSIGIGQKWLAGTQAQISLQGNRYDSDAAFRSFNPTYADRLLFQMRQPLLKNFWGRPDKALRKKARSNVLAAKARLNQAAQELTLRVVETYLDLLFTREDLEIKVQALNNLNLLLKRQQEKLAYGIVEETDILQTKSAIQLKELEVRIAETSAKVAKQNLLTLMSFEKNSEGLQFAPVETPNLKNDDFENLIEQSVEKRFDLLAIQAQVQALEAELRSVKLGSLPSLDLTGQYGLNSLSSSFSRASSDLMERGKPYYLLGLELRIPLLGKMEKVDIKLAEAKLEQATQSLDAIKKRALQEIKNRWDLYHLSLEKAKAMEEVVKIQRAKYAEEEKNFKRGRSITDTLIRFQADVYDSQSKWVQSGMDAMKAEMLLQAATGRLGEIFPLPGY